MVAQPVEDRESVRVDIAPVDHVQAGQPAEQNPRRRTPGLGDRPRIEVVWPVAEALEVLGCLRALVELQQSAVLLQQRRADLGRGREEELSAFVNEVDSARAERTMRS